MKLSIRGLLVALALAGCDPGPESLPRGTLGALCHLDGSCVGTLLQCRLDWRGFRTEYLCIPRRTP